MDTITQQQAIERVDRYISEAVAALPVKPELTEPYVELEGDCSDPTDSGPRNRILVTKSYFLHGIPKTKADNRTYFDAARNWWITHGFRILKDDQSEDMYLWVENNSDGFRMSLQESAEGSVSIGATSPCIWPNGTPEPDS